MLCGIPPFRAKSRNALQLQIQTGKPKYPKFLSNDALSMLKVGAQSSFALSCSKC